MPKGNTLFPLDSVQNTGLVAKEHWLKLRRNKDGILTPEQYDLLFNNECQAYRILDADEAAELDTDEPWGVLYYDGYWVWLRDPVQKGEGDLFFYIRLVTPDLSRSVGVIVIPELDGKIYLAKADRHATRRSHYEIPRGFAERVIEGALQELSEEAGVKAGEDQLHGISRLFLDSGLVGQDVAVLHVAVESHQIGEIAPEPTESIEKGIWVDRSKFFEMIRNGEITDGPTLAALMTLLAQDPAPKGSKFFSDLKPSPNPEGNIPSEVEELVTGALDAVAHGANTQTQRR